MYRVKAPKKLIEVALPLKEINEACIREKSIRHGHPSTLHLYWARRPLAAARAVLFAQLVNDPGWDEELKIGYKRKADANKERERLFEIIRKLVKWENTNNEAVLNEARTEIRKSWKVTCDLNKDHPEASELFNPDVLPAFHDPFAGGGSIPLEAQRLGLEAWASDLNPVAVLINKAMIEIPPRFVGRRPTGPIPEHEKQLDIGQYSWGGMTGFAEDVRRYGYWVRQEAFKRIGHLYPPIEITSEMVVERSDMAQYLGKNLTVIAYIWARTVKSPNPLFSHVDVPLVSTFLLSDKKGKEAWIEPVIHGENYEFHVRIGLPDEIETVKKGTKTTGRTSNFYCILSNTPIDGKYIKAEAQAGRMSSKLMAIVCEGNNSRVYLSPNEYQDNLAKSIKPTWKPDQELVGKSADQVPLYGMRNYGDLFSDRQIFALESIAKLVDELLSDVVEERKEEGNPSYKEAIRTFLHLCIGKLSIQSSVLSTWDCTRDGVRSAFGRQALAMVWDYAEVNILSESTGNWLSMLNWVSKAILNLPAYPHSFSVQYDACTQDISAGKVVSTDPPYYDNIMYADLSDFFYVFQKRSMKPIYSELFQTIATPKDNELVASQYRHKTKKLAEAFFLEGMIKAMSSISKQAHPSFPITIYYAFKQSETSESGSISTGWVTFLEAVMKSDMAIVGTWPMRTELANKVSGIGSNMLSSSIILVCRKRSSGADTISRKEFMQEVNQAIPKALETMINGSETSSPVAPVDLAQSAIGPGMAVYSKYKAILESDGSPMTVHTALILINKALDEYFKEREGDWDNDTRFCLQWFSEYGWKEGVYGEAEVLAKAKGLSVEGVRDSGVLIAGSGKVRLYRPSEYPSDWNPLKDDRTPVWEVLHQLIRAHQSSGESAAAVIASAVPELAATARQLAFLLYTLCERQGWAEDARPYNDLVTAWLSIEKQAQDKGIKDDQIEAEF